MTNFNEYTLTANRLMHALGQLIDIDALMLTEDGTCTLSFDHLVVQFELDAASATLVLSSVLAELPGDADASLFKRLLQANASQQDTSSAFMGLDPTCQFLLLIQPMSLALSHERFVAAAEAYLNMADAWLQVLDTWLTDGSKTIDAPTVPNGFVRA